MAKKKTKNEETEEDGGKGKGGKVKIVAVGAIGLAAVYKFVLAPSPAETVDPDAAAEEAPVEEGEIFPMEEMVVNLADTDENRYLRVGLALVLEAGTPATVMETESPIAVDAAIELLSEMTFNELREPGAKAKIREDLSASIRAAYDDEKVVRVLLTTFVMQ